MKRWNAYTVGLRLLALLLLPILCLSGCLQRGTPPIGSDTDTNSNTSSNTAHGSSSEPLRGSGTPQGETQKADKEAAEEQALLDSADYRILLTTDTHYTYRSSWYGVTPEARMQMWVDAILAEHQRRPFDLILIMGDVSLDHWKWQGGGSWLKDGISTTKLFVENYVSQLPEDVPVRILAGNHEQYSNEQWRELTGNDRTCSFVLGDNLFIMPDSFGGELDPDYHHDGVYTPMDVAYIQEQMDAYPNHKVYLVSHYFNMSLESDEFKQLLRENSRIVTLFQGHTHQRSILSLDADCGSKYILQCGNFSYVGSAQTTEEILDSFWGFRDLILTKERAVSRYIIAESDAVVNESKIHMDRAVVSIIPFKLKK